MTLDVFHQRFSASLRCPGAKRIYNARAESVAALPGADCPPGNCFTDRHYEHSNSIGVLHELSDVAMESDLAHAQ